jgi:hypothetical protein
MRRRPVILIAALAALVTAAGGALAGTPAVPSARLDMTNSGPTVAWTHFVKSHGIGGSAVALDGAGNVILAGATADRGNATAHAFQRRYGGGATDAYIAKYAPNGALLWLTYLGGRGEDHIADVQVDRLGRIVFAGGTDSPDFPTFHAWHGRTPPRGMANPRQYVPDSILGVLNADGHSLAFSTYLGAPANDEAHRVRIGRDGSLTVAGMNTASLVSATSAESRTIPATRRALRSPLVTSFIARVSPAWKLQWVATPGVLRDHDAYDPPDVVGLDVDSAGTVYYAATAYRPWELPTPTGYRTAPHGGADWYAAALSSDGRRLRWAAFVGGHRDDVLRDAAVTSDGLALVGSTTSVDFPRVRPVQRGCAARSGSVNLTDIAVTKIALDGSRLSLATCIGGTATEGAARIAAAPDGDLYIVGTTASPNIPMVHPWQMYAGSAVSPTDGDCYLAKINARGALAWASPLGGHDSDACDAESGDVAFGAGVVIATGDTNSVDLPGSRPVEAARAMRLPLILWSAFVTRVEDSASAPRRVLPVVAGSTRPG